MHTRRSSCVTSTVGFFFAGYMIGKAVPNKCLPVGRHHTSLVILLFNLTVGSYPEITALIPNHHAPGTCPFLHGNRVNSRVGARSSTVPTLPPHPPSYFYSEEIFFTCSCSAVGSRAHGNLKNTAKTIGWIGLLRL